MSASRQEESPSAIVLAEASPNRQGLLSAGDMESLLPSYGFLVEGLGWENFFILCTLLAIPGMLLLFKVAPWNGKGSVFE